jgi:hypothetical protein
MNGEALEGVDLKKETRTFEIWRLLLLWYRTNLEHMHWLGGPARHLCVMVKWPTLNRSAAAGTGRLIGTYTSRQHQRDRAETHVP